MSGMPGPTAGIKVCSKLWPQLRVMCRRGSMEPRILPETGSGSIPRSMDTHGLLMSDPTGLLIAQAGGFGKTFMGGLGSATILGVGHPTIMAVGLTGQVPAGTGGRVS